MATDNAGALARNETCPGVAFSKGDNGNWGVPWHQDRVIAVADRFEVDGFCAWSRKVGVWHCAPPIAVLDKMLFVRVHLDDCGTGDGAMEIALGSHLAGEIASSDTENAVATCDTEMTIGQAGDVLVMHMLVLHRSLPSTSRKTRRVLRVDLADRPLPEPLRWALST